MVQKSRKSRNRTNDFEPYMDYFDFFESYKGIQPKKYIVDFVGVMTHVEFRQHWLHLFPEEAKARYVETKAPTPSTGGEFWFEALNWFESARNAKGRYVMFSLGAHFGYQAVAAAKTLMKVNPLPFKLVCVEPEPTQIKWISRHMTDNGINPEDQWIVPLVLGENSDPIFFPVGAPGAGAHNSFSTNENVARENYVKELSARGNAEKYLRELIVNNSTSIEKTIIPNSSMYGEIKILSATTLSTLLGPFEYVDFIESDIQESEKIVFPEAIEILTKKVKRISIGTHGEKNHRDLLKLFKKAKWDILFDFAPETIHQTDVGSLEMNDGVLVVLNPFI